MATGIERDLPLARGAYCRLNDGLVWRNVCVPNPSAEVASGQGHIESSIRALAEYSCGRNLSGTHDRPEAPRASPDVRHGTDRGCQLAMGERAARPIRIGDACTSLTTSLDSGRFRHMRLIVVVTRFHSKSLPGHFAIAISHQLTDPVSDHST